MESCPAAGAPPGAVRGIVFDLDGTLIDSYEAIARSLNHALSRLGFRALEPSRVRAMVGRGLEVLMHKALGEAAAESPELVEEGVRLFRQHYDVICLESTRLLPDVGETLRALHGRGYRLSVATNKPSYFAKRLLDSLAVGRYLTAVVGPDLVAQPKPSPEMVHAALLAMALRPDEAVYVGDMGVDVETARAAGMRVMVLPTGSSDIEELRSVGADLVFERFADLLELLPEHPGDPPP